MTQKLLKTAVSQHWVASKILSGLLRRAGINHKSRFARQLAFAATPTAVGSSSYSKNMIPAARDRLSRMAAVTKASPARALAEIESVADQKKVGT